MPAYAPRQPRKGGGAEWTQEQKDEYQRQWDAYRKRMAKVQPGQARDFTARLIEITDLTPLQKTYNGVTTVKDRRIIWYQLVEPGLDMLRFRCDSADNPFFHKTKLNECLRAHGVFPKEEDGLDIEFEDLYGQTAIITIQKGDNREDGKYGGFYSNLIGIKPNFDDEEEEEEAPPTKPVARKAVAASGGTRKPQPKPAPVEDETPPWDVDDEVEDAGVPF